MVRWGLILLSVLGAATMPAVLAGAQPDWSQAAWCPESGEDERAEDGTHAPLAIAPGVEVSVDALCAVAGGAKLAPEDACTRAAHATMPWRLARPWSARVDASASGLPQDAALPALEAAAAAWDAETPALLHAGFQPGGSGQDAGRYDGVDQVGWKVLRPRTLAVTTTWYESGTGAVLESDVAFNARLAWSTTGARGSFDVQHVAAHELGHVYGLRDVGQKEDSCLTMYGRVARGDTHGRTLELGDVLGLRAIYGAS